MIQLGNRYRRLALLAVAALGTSTNALAQTPAPEPPSPAPSPTETPTNPATGDPNAQPLTPAPTPPTTPEPAPPAPAPEPPKTVFPAMAGPALRLSEIFSFRPGFLLQLWASETQDSLKKENGDAGDFAQNIYIRRARFFVGGGIGKDVSYFVLFEASNIGLGTPVADGSVNKNFQTLTMQDVFADLKINKFLSIQGGLMLIPLTRNILQSTATYWPIDIAGVSATHLAPTQTSLLRDTGVQIKLNALDNHFETRLMVAQGIRLADGAGRAPGKNDFRLTGFMQYNFLDSEAGYVFNGQYFGRKKVAGVSAGLDFQKTQDANPYWALSATAHAAIPLSGTADPKNGGDEIGGQIEYLHFHNGRIPTAALGRQDDLNIEAGYYNKNAKFSVYGKFEGRFFDKDVVLAPGVTLDVQNTRLFGFGVKYFLAEAFANVTLQYSLTQFPNQDSAVRNSANSIQAQLQLTYF